MNEALKVAVLVAAFFAAYFAVGAIEVAVGPAPQDDIRHATR